VPAHRIAHVRDDPQAALPGNLDASKEIRKNSLKHLPLLESASNSIGIRNKQFDY